MNEILFKKIRLIIAKSLILRVLFVYNYKFNHLNCSIKSPLLKALT